MVYLICKHNSVSCVLPVKESDTLRGIKHRICERWSFLKEDSMSLSYSLPGNAKCLLVNNEDVELMLGVSASFNSSHISVEVVCNASIVASAGADVVGNASSASSSSKESAASSSVSEVEDDDTDLLRAFCPRKEKVLLTKGWDKCVAGTGQKFVGGAYEFRKSLCKMALESGFDFRYTKNDDKRIVAECAKKDDTHCAWMVRAKKEAVNGYFYVTAMNEFHTCGTSSRSFNGHRMSSDLVSDLVCSDVHGDPSVKPIDMKRRLFSTHGLPISYYNTWTGIEKAKNALYGDMKESFNSLNSYISSIVESNPDSYVRLEVDEESNRFKRVFVAFHGCIEGFKHCRPLLCLDGSHLKTRFKGQLLSAIAKDGDQGLYPVCFAVVDSENFDNWHWFLMHLKNIVDPARRLTFISDRNTGLLDSMPVVFPDSDHTYCLFHLRLNLLDRFRGTRCSKVFKDRMVYLLRQCAYAPTIDLYDSNMADMLKEGKKVVEDFFSSLPPEKWTNAHFKGMRWGEMSSSAVESFNSWVITERHLPVCNMIDAIRLKLMKQLSDRRSDCASWNSAICPTIDKILADSLVACRSWIIVNSFGHVFEVLSTPSCMVDLDKRTCSCNVWQLLGYPCDHAVGCITRTGLPLHQFVDVGFLTSSYVACYNYPIYPVPLVYKLEDASNVSVLPPISKRQPGRPRKRRIPSRGEYKREMICGHCNKLGHHNKRTCFASVTL